MKEKTFKIIDYFFKTIFFSCLGFIVLFAIFTSIKLIIKDDSPTWIKIFSLFFSISLAYMLITKKDN